MRKLIFIAVAAASAAVSAAKLDGIAARVDDNALASTRHA